MTREILVSKEEATLLEQIPDAPAGLSVAQVYRAELEGMQRVMQRPVLPGMTPPWMLAETDYEGRVGRRPW